MLSERHLLLPRGFYSKRMAPKLSQESIQKIIKNHAEPTEQKGQKLEDWVNVIVACTIVLLTLVFALIFIVVLLMIALRDEIDASVSTPATLTSTTASNSTIGLNQNATRKVLLIVVDGIPMELIEAMSLTNMKSIRSIGYYSRMYATGKVGTYAQTPAHFASYIMNIITGTWANKHNVLSNDAKAPNYHYKNIFRLLKEHDPQKKIAIFSSSTDTRVRLMGEGASKVDAFEFDYKFDEYEFDNVSYPHDDQYNYINRIDERITNELVHCIQTFAPDLSFAHFKYTERVAKIFGNSAQLNQSIIELDHRIGQVWEAIQHRQNLFDEDWLLLITTNHGQNSFIGQHYETQSYQERTTWLLTNNNNIHHYFCWFRPSSVDLYPTIAHFLSIPSPIETAQELDGISMIGNISLVNLNIVLMGNVIELQWKAFDTVGNVTIWLSTTNSFVYGGVDDYRVMGMTYIAEERILINVQGHPSNFYKIIVQGRYNMLKSWLFRFT